MQLDHWCLSPGREAAQNSCLRDPGTGSTHRIHLDWAGLVMEFLKISASHRVLVSGVKMVLLSVISVRPPKLAFGDLEYFLKHAFTDYKPS